MMLHRARITALLFENKFELYPSLTMAAMHSGLVQLVLFSY